jgi:hypothetical protein
MPGTTLRVERADARRMLRIVSIFLDVPSRSVREALHDLRFSNAHVRTMTRLAELWEHAFAPIDTALRSPAPLDDAAIRGWAAQTGRTLLAPFLRLAAARWAAVRASGDDAPARERVDSAYGRALRVAYRDPIELADLGVDGEDLQREGIAHGPLLGKILRSLLAWVVEDPARNVPDRLLAHARDLARNDESAAGRTGGDIS